MATETFDPKAFTNEDSEIFVLGACMLEPESTEKAVALLKPHHFMVSQNRLIWEAIEFVYKDHGQVDILSVTHNLRSRGVLDNAGGPIYISKLTNRVASTARLHQEAMLLKQNYMNARLSLGLGARAKAITPYTDPFESIQAVRDLADKIEGDETSGIENVLSAGEISDELYADIASRKENNSSIVGVPTGITGLDNILGGCRKGNVIVVAGRPGMGKSSLVSTIAGNVGATFKIPIAIFSLEMTRKEMLQCVVAANQGVTLDDISRNVLSFDKERAVLLGIQALALAPIFIDDTPGLTIPQFRSKARMLVRKHGVKIIAIDYVQKMKSGEKGLNGDAEIGKITGAIKEVAKELDIPIIELAQLSRAVETRGGDKIPMLSDLRESGNIEQDADSVVFVYRPEYYGIEQDAEGNSTRNKALLIVAKNRHGSLDDILVDFYGSYKKFCDEGGLYEIPRNPLAAAPVAKTIKPNMDFSQPKKEQLDEQD